MIRKRFQPSLIFILFLAASIALSAQTSSQLPHIVKKDGRYALFVDGAPYLMLGAQVNNSSGWPASLPKVWPAIQAIHANTVEIPIYWEQLEPQPGHFDYSVMVTILAQARAHHVHLVFLWFGTWKNGSSHYTPAWIKEDNAKYPRVVDSKGRNVDSPSPFATGTMKADVAAFSALMRHLKAADPQHTVLMVQVENEAGTYGSVRNYSPTAQKAFEDQVPAKLLTAMQKQPGTWQQVFGDDADEYFHAWFIASYIEQVAAAGKAIYPLPLYVNAALRDPLNPGKASTYESGGPTDNVIPIWKAAAPDIDLIAPDIYIADSLRYFKVLDLYHRPDNPLFVPETGNEALYARYFFAALGHQTIGFSPFGLDQTGYLNFPLGAERVDKELLDTFGLNYELIGPMQREIAKLNFEGKLQAVCEEKDVPSQSLHFGDWEATISYGLHQFGPGNHPAGNPKPIGRALIAQLKDNEFLVTGLFSRVDFKPSDENSGKQRQFIRVEEGHYENSTWHFDRIWNGDQTDWGLNFTSVPQVLRVTLGTF